MRVPTPAIVTFETDMDSYRNGKVTIDGVTGISITKTKNIGQSVTAAAYEGSDQTYNGYKWIFNDTEAPLNKSKWQVERQLVTTLYTNNSSFTRTLTTEDDGATYKSVLKKEVNVTFKNEFVGFPNLGGQVIVNNGAPENAPSANYNVVKQNTITATAINSQEFSENIGIKYDTYGWFNESGTRDYGGPTATFNPTDLETYVSKMRGTPRFSNNNYRNLRSNYGPKNINKPVRLMWNEHPNSYVTQYRVYRTATGENNRSIDNGCKFK